MTARSAFHLAFPVLDIENTRRFYRDVLGCAIGRETDEWIDLDLAGHQLSAHRVERMPSYGTNDVDGCQVPVLHFGLVLPLAEWERLRERLDACEVEYLIPPHVRFKGKSGEQHTMFIRDPSGNGLEFKGFKDLSAVFS